MNVSDVGQAMTHGDPVARMGRSAQYVGETMARIVKFSNPGLILIGGTVPDVGDIYLTRVRQVVLTRCYSSTCADSRVPGAKRDLLTVLAIKNYQGAVTRHELEAILDVVTVTDPSSAVVVW